MSKRKPIPVTALSLGDYLRWLASTMPGEPCVAKELLARAFQADDLAESLERLCWNMQFNLAYGRQGIAVDLARAAIAKAGYVDNSATPGATKG